MQLIVLSAGKGSRLPNKFRKKPKCLVELNSKPLLTYNEDFFAQFKKKIIITGYKQRELKKFATKLKFTCISNTKYRSTNMVYSLFLTKKLIQEDVVIVYGDVVFDKMIYSLLIKSNNILPVNINWFKNWKKRMSLPKILKDAENLFIKNDYLTEIGTKIEKDNFPNFQFMGILKLKKESYMNCYNFFKKIKNNKIDMTSFLNLCVKKKILSIKIEKYKKYWYEIDTISDYKFAQQELKKLFKQ